MKDYTEIDLTRPTTDEYSAGLRLVLKKLNEVTKDRDEWKTQHDNLLAMYRAQTAELARVKDEFREYAIAAGEQFRKLRQCDA